MPAPPPPAYPVPHRRNAFYRAPGQFNQRERIENEIRPERPSLMRHNCVQAAERLADRAQAIGVTGTTIPAATLFELEAVLGLTLPDWLRQIFTEVPLCGLPLGHQVQPPDDNDDGILFVQWATAADIRSESVDCYPGLAICPLGYVNVAGNDGSGDPLFVCIREGDDPPVYRIYHDVSDKGDVIVAQGRVVEAPSLSNFFDSAVVRSA